MISPDFVSPIIRPAAPRGLIHFGHFGSGADCLEPVPLPPVYIQQRKTTEPACDNGSRAPVADTRLDNRNGVKMTPAERKAGRLLERTKQKK